MRRLVIAGDDLVIALLGTAIGALVALIVNVAASVQIEEELEEIEVELTAPTPVEVHLSPSLRRAPAADKAPARNGESHA